MEGSVIVIWHSVHSLAPLPARYDKRCGSVDIHLFTSLISWFYGFLLIRALRMHCKIRHLENRFFLYQWLRDAYNARCFQLACSLVCTQCEFLSGSILLPAPHSDVSQSDSVCTTERLSSAWTI